MSLVNIISAIGNNSSVYPLLVRDCGIEVPSKVALTYKQNLKDSKQMAYNATRERLIDEYTTSAVWLGGIPLINKICNWGIKKAGYNPNINISLYDEKNGQGLKTNIEKFKEAAPKEVKELEKVLKNKSAYQKLQAGKFIISTSIPIALMGYIIPKLNFKLTEIIRKKQELKKNDNLKNLSFKGVSSSLANMSTVNKMAVTDGGYAIGRIYTGRNKYEKMEMSFKMSGMMFLNFLAPIWIAKGLDKFSQKVFKINVNLDPKLLNNSDYFTKDFELPEDNIIEFLDKKPNSKFSKLCEEYCGVKYLANKIRDPRESVNIKKIERFVQEIKNFISEAQKSGNIKKYGKKALKIKSANILANIGISSFLLAAVLPEATFMLRKLVTGSDAEPGLIQKF